MDIYKIKHDKSINNEELIMQAKAGDTYAKELLFQNNIPYVRELVHRWRRRNPECDLNELISIGLWGLTRAYNGYDPDSGVKFLSYAKKVIINLFKNHVYHETRERFTKYKPISMDMKIDEDGDDTFHDLVSCETSETFDSIIDNVYIHEILNQVRDQVSHREYTVFEMYFLRRYTYGRIGEEIGISRQRVHQIVLKLLPKIKSIMTKNSA